MRSDRRADKAEEARAAGAGGRSKVRVLGGKRGEMEKLPRCKNMRIASPTSTLNETTPTQERYAHVRGPANRIENARPCRAHVNTQRSAWRWRRWRRRERTNVPIARLLPSPASREAEEGRGRQRIESSGQLSKPPTRPPVPPPGTGSIGQ